MKLIRRGCVCVFSFLVLWHEPREVHFTWWGVAWWMKPQECNGQIISFRNLANESNFFLPHTKGNSVTALLWESKDGKRAVLRVHTVGPLVLSWYSCWICLDWVRTVSSRFAQKKEWKYMREGVKTKEKHNDGPQWWDGEQRKVGGKIQRKRQSRGEKGFNICYAAVRISGRREKTRNETWEGVREEFQ